MTIPTNLPNALKTILNLRRMQAQIIHGKNTFGEIADLIMWQSERLERYEKALEEIAGWGYNNEAYVKMRQIAIKALQAKPPHTAEATQGGKR